MTEKQRPGIHWTPEQRAQHQAIRDAFRDWHLGPEELIASGAAARLGLAVVHFPAHDLLRDLKESCEAAALTLAEVAGRCGIDEGGRQTVGTRRRRRPGHAAGGVEFCLSRRP